DHRGVVIQPFGQRVAHLAINTDPRRLSDRELPVPGDVGGHRAAHGRLALEIERNRAAGRGGRHGGGSRARGRGGLGRRGRRGGRGRSGGRGGGGRRRGGCCGLCSRSRGGGGGGGGGRRGRRGGRCWGGGRSRLDEHRCRCVARLCRGVLKDDSLAGN